MNNIAFLTIYFGSKPKFLNLFLQTAKHNSDFDFFILSDWTDLPICADNIFHKYLTLDKFSSLAIKKGILKNKIETAYKLCDLKPAWFHIIEDFLDLSNYEFIGYLDIDLIIGNLNHFITIERLKHFDILSISPHFMSGVLTLIRNTPRFKLLYQSNDSWKYIFNNPNSFAFDEDLSFRKNILSNHPYNLSSFSDIVAKEEENGLKVFHGNHISYGKEKETFYYNNGIIKDKKGNEFIIYDLVYVKHNFFWYYPDWKFLPKKFFINKFGLYRNKYFPLKRFIFFCIPPYCIQTFKRLYSKKHRIIYHIRNNSWLSILKSL